MNRANRPRLSRISGSSYASKLLGRAGDGSTLSLDFTTGQLDPRLTFTRGSNATFINSSGLVEWAAANNFTNSTFSGSSGTTVPNWSFSVVSGAATVSLSGTALTITCTTATRARVVQSIGTGTGLQVTTQVRVTARSMAFPLNEVLAYSVNGSSGDQYKVNGVNQISSYTGWSVGDVISLTCIPTSGAAAQAVIGIGASAAQPAGQSITITDVQAEPGTSARTVVSTGTSGSYQAPRFDYDPTTLAPQGLLIEGSAVNAALNSDVMRGTGWVATNLVTPSNAAGVTDPANGTNSTNYIANGTTGYHGGGVVSTTTGASTTIITWSCWVKANGYTKVLMAEGNSGRGAVSFDIDPNNVTPPAPTVVGGTGSPTGTITRYPNNWYRIAMRVGVASSTAYQWSVIGYPTGATLGIFGAQYTGDSTNGIYVWGAQLEDGSGASSYIPTGASTVQRLPDICSITSPNFAPWYGSPTGWTVVAEMTPQSRAAGSFPGMIALRSAADSGLRIYYYNDGTYNTAFRFGTASTSAEVFGPNGVTYGVPRKFGASVTSGTQFASSAGVQIGATQTLAVPMDQTLLAIGSDGVSPTPTVNCRMHFRSIKYWPYAMTLADLNARTA